MRLQAQLEGKVEVVPCMVDRICAGREIEGGPNPSITVEAEDHAGSIVLLNPPEVQPAPMLSTHSPLLDKFLVMVPGWHSDWGTG
jgi:hypothetical protein